MSSTTASSRKNPVLQCLSNQSKTWWTCPPSISIFVSFIIIFIFSVFVLVECTYLINQAAKLEIEVFEQVYKKKLSTINAVFIMNNLLCFISVLVIFGFILKTIPETILGAFFNYTVGILIGLFIFIVSCVTMGLYNGMNFDNANAVVGFSAFLLVMSLVVVSLFSYQVHLSIINNKKKRG